VKFETGPADRGTGPTVQVAIHQAQLEIERWTKVLPQHSGTRYFSRLSVVYIRNRSRIADCKTYQLPETQTDPMSTDGM
jgi:hypothetical protein